MIPALVEPVFQEYVPPPDAVSVIVLPLQTVVAPLMLAVGAGVTVMDEVAEFVHPFPSVTVTVYVVFAVGESVMDAEVAPLFHQE